MRGRGTVNKPCGIKTLAANKPWGTENDWPLHHALLLQVFNFVDRLRNNFGGEQTMKNRERLKKSRSKRERTVEFGGVCWETTMEFGEQLKRECFLLFSSVLWNFSPEPFDLFLDTWHTSAIRTGNWSVWELEVIWTLPWYHFNVDN
jgi:hypothetical protein